VYRVRVKKKIFEKKFLYDDEKKIFEKKNFYKKKNFEKKILGTAVQMNPSLWVRSIYIYIYI
jgi:hypothetical protein